MYKIRIERVEKELQTVKEWKQLTENCGQIPGKYGYVEVEKWVEITTGVLTQELEELDVRAVIKAVNGL